jgi:hypothetical protein
MEQEHIGYEGDPNNWLCLCGNKPYDDGFFPCALDGVEVEPTPEEWPLRFYVCDRCGRIVDFGTRIVVGRKQEATTPRWLPEFAGYTVDARLRQFRKVPADGWPEYIEFASPEGERLLERLHRALLDGAWRHAFAPPAA